MGFFAAIVMFIVVAVTFYICLHRRMTLQSKLLGWPIFKVAYYALGIQIAISLVSMSVAELCPRIVIVIVEIIVFALTAACLVIRDTMQHILVSSENEVKNDTTAWKNIRKKVYALATTCSNPELKKLAEDIRFTDPTMKDGDEEIERAIDTLCESSPEMISRNTQIVRTLLAKREIK